MKFCQLPFKILFGRAFAIQFCLLALIVADTQLAVRADETPVSSGAVSTSPAGKDKDAAIAAYKAGRLNDALSKFQLLAKVAPNDATVHCYLGMCYQALKQDDKAKAHYQRVLALTKESALLTAAGKGIAALSAPKSQTANVGGRPSVIDFSAVWCVPCKKFEPIFNRVANDYKGRVDFLHVDVDDPKQKKLVDRYKIQIMPTLVFCNERGIAKLINEGVMDEKSLVKEVNTLLK